jgi:hypothetical protein
MLSSNASDALDIVVKHSIHLFMDENINDCLGDNGEIVDITYSEILDLFYDCELYLENAEKEVDFNLDGDNVITGRFTLWNPLSVKLLKPFKNELIGWASNFFPVVSRWGNAETKESEFCAIVWLAYLKNNLDKVKEYYINERFDICDNYDINLY